MSINSQKASKYYNNQMIKKCMQNRITNISKVNKVKLLNAKIQIEFGQYLK